MDSRPLFGVNWKTTVTGIGSALTGLLTVLAAAPYEFGAIADVVSPETKKTIFIVGAIATFILRCINAKAQKDATVAGNGSVQEPYKMREPSGFSSKTIAPALLALLIPVVLLTGCAGWSAGGSACYTNENGVHVCVDVRHKQTPGGFAK